MKLLSAGPVCSLLGPVLLLFIIKRKTNGGQFTQQRFLGETQRIFALLFTQEQRFMINLVKINKQETLLYCFSTAYSLFRWSCEKWASFVICSVYLHIQGRNNDRYPFQKCVFKWRAHKTFMEICLFFWITMIPWGSIQLKKVVKERCNSILCSRRLLRHFDKTRAEKRNTQHWKEQKHWGVLERPKQKSGREQFFIINRCSLSLPFFCGQTAINSM